MSLLYNRSTDLLLEREQLDMLPTPKPSGRFHKIYPFSEYVEDIHDSLRRHGISVSDEQYVLSHGAQRMFGLMTIETQEKDWKLALGVRGSHDKSVARGIALGTNVMVCSNLCFSGELFMDKAKQTLFNGDKIKSIIDVAISVIPNALQEQKYQFFLYKGTELPEEEINTIIAEAFRQGYITGTQMGRVIREYDNPTYPEHNTAGNLWKLFNAFTQAIKPTGNGVDMNTVVRRTTGVTKVINAAISVSAEVVEETEEHSKLEPIGGVII